MAIVIWTEPARRDLEGVRNYIGQFSPLAAVRFAERLRSAAESLRQNPARGRPIARNRKELTIVRLYNIRYRVEDDVVVILRIRHGARRPN